MTANDGPRLETIALVEEECIVQRGSARRTWHVRQGERWVRARELPGAQIEPLDPKPGTVWQCRIELRLPVGADLLLTQSFPMFERATPLAHLERGPKAGRRVQRTPYRVGRGGRVEPT